MKKDGDKDAPPDSNKRILRPEQKARKIAAFL
jgi:hypothetical protein